MRVECLTDCELVLPSGSTRTHPKGWVGDVPDEAGQAWIEAKAAKFSKPPVILSDTQTEILAAAADEIMAVQQSQAGSEAVETAAPAGVDLERATVVELRAMAIGRGIKGAAQMRKSDLIAALSQA